MAGWRMPNRQMARLLTCAVVFAVAVCGLPPCVESADRGFVQHMTGDPPSLDPAKTSSVLSDQVMWLLYDRLTQLSADGTRMEPALAERWEQSADGLTYTFTLRRNVLFHDGSPLDAEAVKISYERQFLPTSPFYAASPPNAYERILSGLVKSIRVLDSHTVAIALHYQRPHQFAIVNIVGPQALKRFGGHLTRTPVGTGPFRLDRWEADRIVLVPFANSWRGRPRVSNATFIVVPDSQAAVERLEAGEFDLMPRVPPHLLERVGADPNLRLVELGGLNVRFLGMRMDSRALRDRRIREAIVRAVDLERLAGLLGRGTLRVAWGPLPPASLGYDSQVRQPAHDPQRARALLGEAGLESPLPLRLLYPASLEHWSEVAQAVRADLRKVGFQVELLGVPDWKAFHEQRRKEAHDLYLYQWSVSTPDPERFLFPLYHSTSPDNYGRYANPKVDEALTQARQPMEDAKRLRLYREVSRSIAADIPALFLFHQTAFAAHHVRAHGLILNLYGWPQDKLSTVEIR